MIGVHAHGVLVVHRLPLVPLAPLALVGGVDPRVDEHRPRALPNDLLLEELDRLVHLAVEAVGGEDQERPERLAAQPVAQRGEGGAAVAVAADGQVVEDEFAGHEQPQGAGPPPGSPGLGRARCAGSGWSSGRRWRRCRRPAPGAGGRGTRPGVHRPRGPSPRPAPVLRLDLGTAAGAAAAGAGGAGTAAAGRARPGGPESRRPPASPEVGPRPPRRSCPGSVPVGYLRNRE